MANQYGRNLLGSIQQFATRTGIPVPTTGIGNPDAQVRQIIALANEVCEFISSRTNWGVLSREATFTTIAAEDQGTLETITGDPGFLYIRGDTLYNRTLRLPVFGPIGDRQWQALKALPAVGPYYKYRIRGDHFLMNPTPPAGHTIAFEYASRSYVLASDESTKKIEFTSDSDFFVLSDVILIAGLRWKWKSEKGLDYAQEFADFEYLVTQKMGADSVKSVLDMATGETDFRPGIFVPSGNWNLP